MCLYVRKGQRYKIAKEDITCYKYVKKTTTKDEFCTPIQESLIKIGETYHSEFERVCCGDITMIEKALHSFVNEDDALLRKRYSNYVAVECVIPKGSKYYLGEYKRIVAAYASNALKYIRIIE